MMDDERWIMLDTIYLWTIVDYDSLYIQIIHYSLLIINFSLGRSPLVLYLFFCDDSEFFWIWGMFFSEIYIKFISWIA